MIQRLKRIYLEQISPQLYKDIQYKNIHQIPRLTKVVIHRGLGAIAQNSATFEAALLELTTITTQRGTITRARNSLAGFKIRRGIPIGVKVTLRGDRIYAFIDRLLNLALPRIRDFQGVKTKSFDGNGNYNLGLEDQLIFPEVRYAEVSKLLGIDLSIVTSTSNYEERIALLERLGIPFQNLLIIT
jgi:large subunit ribosomal protein L5